MKFIDYRIFNPTKSLFKNHRNDRATYKKAFCSNTDKCEAFKNGSCTMFRFSIQSCKYGKIEAKTADNVDAKGRCLIPDHNERRANGRAIVDGIKYELDS